MPPSEWPATAMRVGSTDTALLCSSDVMTKDMSSAWSA